jgi:LacI family transcriptional regulator
VESDPARIFRLPRVALLVETSTTWGNHLIRGVARYAREHGPWLFVLEPRGRGEKLRIPKGWTGDGVIARVNSPELAEDIARVDLPAVNLSWYDYTAPRMARCTISERDVAKTAANYLLERGFRSFGYFPAFDRPGYVDRLGPAFAQAVRARGGACELYSGVPYRPETGWDDHLADLAMWLARLRKPVAILAFGDFQGRLIAEACLVAELRVPDDVAVLGSEQDELAAAVSVPELSSIECGGRQVGFRAAEILHKMMNGGPVPPEPIEYASPSVITRQSTEVLAIEDPELAAAFRFIRSHAHEPITVDTVLTQVPLSRRALEQRFSATVGRTPAAAIRRVRLERAKHLLFDTAQGVAEVAHACGFKSPEALARAFRIEFGMTPTEFRSRAYQPPR